MAANTDFMGTQIELLKSRWWRSAPCGRWAWSRTRPSSGRGRPRRLAQAAEHGGRKNRTAAAAGTRQSASRTPSSARAGQSHHHTGAQLAAGADHLRQPGPAGRGARRQRPGAGLHGSQPQPAARITPSTRATSSQERLAQLKLKLQDSEGAVIHYAQQQGLASVDQNTLLATANLQQLNGVLSQAVADRIRAESRWRQAAGSGGRRIAGDAEERSDRQAARPARRTDGRLRGQAPIAAQARSPGDAAAVAADGRGRGAHQGRDRHLCQAARGEYEATLAQRATAAQARGCAAVASCWTCRAAACSSTSSSARPTPTGSCTTALLQRYKEIGVAGDVTANNVSIVDAAQESQRVKPDLPTQRAGRPVTRAGAGHRAGLPARAARRHAEVARGRRGAAGPACARRGAEDRRRPDGVGGAGSALGLLRGLPLAAHRPAVRHR